MCVQNSVCNSADKTNTIGYVFKFRTILPVINLRK